MELFCMLLIVDSWFYVFLKTHKTIPHKKWILAYAKFKDSTKIVKRNQDEMQSLTSKSNSVTDEGHHPTGADGEEMSWP